MNIKQKSLRINFIMNTLLTMSSILFPLITYPYVSRVLLPEGMGKVSFAISFVTYFAMFAQLGIPTYGIRACAKVRDDKEKLSKTVQELFIINMVISAFVYLFFFATVYFVPKLRAEKSLYFIISLIILFNTIGVEWLYKGLEEYAYITIRSLIFKIITVIAMFLLIHEQKDYVIYGFISIIAASGSGLLNFINARKYISIKKNVKYQFREHFKPIAVFFAMSCATTIYTNLDTIMLGFISTDADVGYYNAAVKVKGILVSVVTSLGAVLLPRCAYYYQQGNLDEFKRISKKALHFVMIISIPLMVYFILFAEKAIYFLSGKSYLNAILPMQIIMPTLLFIGITNIFGIQMLVPMGKEKVVLISEIAGAVVNFVLNAILIPQYAAVGAAIGTLVAEFIVLIIQYYVIRKAFPDIAKSISYLKVLGGIGAGILCSSWMTVLEGNMFLILVVSAIVFFGAYFGVLLLAKDMMVLEICGQMFSLIPKKKKKRKEREND